MINYILQNFVNYYNNWVIKLESGPIPNPKKKKIFY